MNQKLDLSYLFTFLLKNTKIFYIDPIYTAEKYCNYNKTNLYAPYIMENGSYVNNHSIRIDNSVNGNISKMHEGFSQGCNLYDSDDFEIYFSASPHLKNTPNHSSKSSPSPNIALLSLILLIGTCVLALTLKKLRRSVFFGAYVNIYIY
jgi:hypothetical protein